MQTDTLIIGGGLSGLSLATTLHAAGHNFLLVEAGGRLGGRILTQPAGPAKFDMGPAWFWPGQPRMAALVQSLGLHVFDQHAAGDLMFEDEQGRAQRGRGMASMQWSSRVAGGLGGVIDGLAQAFPHDRLHLNTQITDLRQIAGGVEATAQSGLTLTANRVVAALPPRIAATWSFSPALPDNSLYAMTAVPTWMAGQAKAVAVYPHPFWRDAGLSGDAMSRFGPMVEIHDASPHDESCGALFGFIGLSPDARQDTDSLRHHILAQLVRLFGSKAENPIDVVSKDWAHDPLTATSEDRAPLRFHPQYGLPASLKGLWGNRLILSGTETAPTFGGYLEGALEAADLTATEILTSKAPTHAL
ncbi:flavin monoamine oxidase family protein [Pseudooctadecabacter jejudonensis]|uniref:Putrescine oxidase n=1 Tax=Pseudooctadecabacter jejudonensis TaxID=1391910 RepID=A0A1Y5SMV6_9RHOB|nr:FAD-dependent oxidoreductase [Pseudooctadecabacter jejudonensis]SLN44385.1 Putrescine oxidase [Pseudooctadecabacter jejudonensis]